MGAKLSFQAIRALKLKMGEEVEDTVLLSRLMAYCSKVRQTAGAHRSLYWSLIINLGLHGTAQQQLYLDLVKLNKL